MLCWLALAAAMAILQSAGDAIFLTEVGGEHLGWAFALSAGLAIFVAWQVGAFADRVHRGRFLAFAFAAAAGGVALVALVYLWSPKATAVLVVVLSKQVAVSLELLLWLALASCFQKREVRRLVPIMIVAHGIGGTAGAFSVGWVAKLGGVESCLWLSALLVGVGFVGAARIARQLGASGESLPETAAREKDRAESVLAVVRARPLARWLAAIVFLSGVFAPLLYCLLRVQASAEIPEDEELAAFLGNYRALVQVLALGTQLWMATVLSRRISIASMVVVAPALALVAGLVLLLVPGSRALYGVLVAQALTRIVDVGVQNPAEQLLQNLLPRDLRGRIAGFLSGACQRSGGMLGGLIVLVLAWSFDLFFAIMLIIGVLWVGVALVLRRRFSSLAIRELLVLPSRNEGEIWDWRRDIHSGEAERAERALRRMREGRLPAKDRATVLAELETAFDKLQGKGNGGNGQERTEVAALLQEGIDWERLRLGRPPKSESTELAALSVLQRARGEEAEEEAMDAAEALVPRIVGKMPTWQVAQAVPILCEAFAEFPNSAMRALLEARIADRATSWARSRDPFLRKAALEWEHAHQSTNVGSLVEKLADRSRMVRVRAGGYLAEIGEKILPELVQATHSAHRRVREHAGELMVSVAPKAASWTGIIDDQLLAMEENARAQAAFASLQGTELLQRRLEERTQGAAQVVLLGLTARTGQAAFALAAGQLGRSATRESSLEALDSLLPPRIAERMVPALEGKIRAQEGELPKAIAKVLEGDDDFARTCVLHCAPKNLLAEHRKAIGQLAMELSQKHDPVDLLSRLIQGDDDEDDTLKEPMPSQYETLSLLGKLPLFRELPTSQLAEIGRAVRWRPLTQGQVLEPGEGRFSMFAVHSGVLLLTGLREERRLAAGDSHGELSLFSDSGEQPILKCDSEEAVVAEISREDIELLVEDAPEIALLFCRSLAEQMQRRSD